MFDPTKPVQTRDGQPVRILSINGSKDYPIVGLIGNDSQPKAWAANGMNCKYKIDGIQVLSAIDLVNVPKKLKGFINIYDCNNKLFTGDVYSTKEEADEAMKTTTKRVACVEFEYEV